MIRGFEIFETKQNGFSNGNELYPPLCRVFYSTFDVGQGKLKIPGVFLDQIKQVAGILEQRIDSDIDFIIQDFLSFEEAQVFIKNSYEEDDNVVTKYYPIAECDSNKALLVGINPENIDQIFIENTNLFPDGERFKFISSNIFEFIKKISYIELERIGYGISDYGQLYKNWNDFNWKVKG